MAHTYQLFGPLCETFWEKANLFFSFSCVKHIKTKTKNCQKSEWRENSNIVTRWTKLFKFLTLATKIARLWPASITSLHHIQARRWWFWLYCYLYFSILPAPVANFTTVTILIGILIYWVPKSQQKPITFYIPHLKTPQLKLPFSRWHFNM